MYGKLLNLYHRIKNERNIEIFYLSALVIFSFVLCFSAINPPALWYDDAWVGLISKVHTLNDFLLVKAVSSPLFSVLQFIAIKLIPDKEIAAQFWPILFYLAQIPLFYYLLKKITNNKLLAFLGAMILAISSRELLIYSTRAKQYSLDSLSTVVLLLFYIKFFTKKINPKHLAAFLLLSLILFLGSFTSIIISGILVHILFFRIVKDWRTPSQLPLVGGENIFIILFFDILAILAYFSLLKTDIDRSIYEYWNNFFINIHQPFFQIVMEAVAKFSFFVLAPFWSVWQFFMDKNCESIFLILLLIILFSGIVYLYKNKFFEIFYFILFFYPTAVVLSAMKLYPLSGGRVDIYSFSITILLGVCGIWQIMTFFKFSVKLQSVFFVYLYMMFFALSFFYFTDIQYPYKINIKNYTDIIEQNITEKDAVLLSPYSDYAFAYYTDWPVEFKKYPTATGFIPVIAKNNVFSLPSVGVFNVDAQSIRNYMDYFLAKADNFDRIYFFNSHCFTEDKKYTEYVYRKYIYEKIFENNFQLMWSIIGEDNCFLKIYQRSDILK